jgi:arylsulfatase A-like enzyme
LVAENAFSNSGNTAGSLTSILTGKLPIETRVLYPPDILVGENAYQHLPGILKQAGYHTVQVTMPRFGDAYERNIRDGFDIANYRTENRFPLATKFEQLGDGSGFYFSAQIIQRIVERLEHAFYIKKMDNAYEMVTEAASYFTEKQRFDAMLSYIDQSDKPIFIHVHMLGTHGPTFEPRKNVFSEGQEQDQPFMLDFYDDAILDFDKYTRSLFNYLSKSEKINNTIVIIYSDHGMRWQPLNRVPLLFWFPNQQYAGRIHENVQLIDIAPTILDYLRIPQPAWMHGQSLLENKFAPPRKIFSVDVAADLVSDGEMGWLVDVTNLSPPFYQLGTVNLVICNRWFSLNLRSPALVYGEVKGSTASCNAKEIPSSEQAEEILLKRLQDEGYDISLFP